MREVYWIGDRFIVEWEDGRVEEKRIKEELKVNWERIIWRIKMNISELMYDLEECKLEVESVL